MCMLFLFLSVQLVAKQAQVGFDESQKWHDGKMNTSCPRDVTQTFSNIANLNFARDTKNKNAKEENEFYDKVIPEISAIDTRFTKILNASKFKSELLNKFG